MRNGPAAPGQALPRGIPVQPEFILLAVGLGMTVLAAIVVFSSMRRGNAPSSAESFSTATTAIPNPFDRRDRATVPPEKLVLRGLQSLLERSPDDAFVIFEHPGTKRFVQFMRTDAGVAIDFPLIELSEDERSRARSLFARHGLPVTQFSGHGDSTDIYQANFGADVDHATKIAVEIFRKVFELDGDFPLYVKTE
jgi:hypothetical protein